MRERAEQLEAWVAGNRWAASTIRSYQDAVGGFLGYVCDARYGWMAECEQRVGAVPAQICHESNSAVHVGEYEGRPARRPLSRVELQTLFDVCDDAVETMAGSGRKGWLAAFRDATLFKTIYGWGLRRREAAMLDVVDFSVNPAAPVLGGLGICHVRFGKAKRGSPPRRRAVATVMPWAAEALGQYLTEIRPRYEAGGQLAVWLTERGGRVSPPPIDERVAVWRGGAGGPARGFVVAVPAPLWCASSVGGGGDVVLVAAAVEPAAARTAKNRMLTDALARAFDRDNDLEQREARR